MRIVTVYTDSRAEFVPRDMAIIRWFRISEALARLGHRVDVAAPGLPWLPRRGLKGVEGVGRVPVRSVRWDRYDVVKTLFHKGFRTLERYGGGEHPFVIAKLGSVVAAEDRPGIYFYGEAREALYRTQARIHRTARYVTVLSEPAGALLEEAHGPRDGVLLVPGAAERDIPPPGPDPYPGRGPRAVFAGNFYAPTSLSQPEAHRTLTDKLNRVGRALRARGIRTFVVGPGEATSLDPDAVTWLGSVPYRASWDYLRHADAGLVVSAGPFQHNNESTKIYHYLRAGLPVVCEGGFPNDGVVRESGLGFVVPSERMDELAERVVQAVERSWDREAAVRYVLRHHTWDRRAEVYARVLDSGG
ncbi:MAG: glycosyltransferase [Gemmatimonadota bacterium]